MISRKSLLYRSRITLFEHIINHIEGCSHGCRYPCYAFLMKQRFSKHINNWNDWIQPKLVENAEEMLEKELKRKRKKVHKIHFSLTTDPFMHNFPDAQRLTIRLMEIIKNHNIEMTLLTKGAYPTSEISKFNCKPGISLVSLNDSFHAQYEPYSTPIVERINALKKLADMGLDTWVCIEPYPTPDIIEQSLYELLTKVSFTNTIVFGKWNYRRNKINKDIEDRFYKECCEQVSEFGDKNNIKTYV